MPPTEPMRAQRRGSVAAVCAALLGLACAAPAGAPREAPRRAPPPPPALQPETLSLPDEQPRPPALRLLAETRFSLFVQDADLRSVLLGLGRGSPLNVVLDPGLQGSVSADLEDASLLEVLDQVIASHGYRYEVEGNLLRISRTERETRTYHFDYPNYVREGSTSISMAGFLASTPKIGESDDSEASDSSTSTLETTTKADLWDEVGRALRSIVFGSPDGGGSSGEAESGEEADGEEPQRVVVSPESGLIVVTAKPDVLAEVERYLSAVADRNRKQVLIDARIVEVTLSDDMDLGVDFEAVSDAAGILSGLFIPGAREATITQTLAPLLTEGGVSFALAKNNVYALINALASQTDVRIVSTPRLATLNNHKAMIKVVRNEIFFVAEVENLITDFVVQQTTEFVPKTVPVGVTLDVTPQVSDDEEITMHVRPSFSEIVSVKLQPTSDPKLPQNGSLPVIDLREADTVLRVPSGETLVIGGLVQSREFEFERKIPLLGDIPLLGYLFRGTQTEERRTELVIFLTPTVLDAPRIARVTRESEEGLRRSAALGERRSLGFPWWRRPFGASYGDFR
jgi:MSHA biogenesis protein MshL